MPWPRFVVVVLVAALLQASLIDSITITRFNATPDLLLIVMIFFAIRCDITEAIISSFAIGLAADMVTPGFPMGPRVISFGLFGTALAHLNRVVTLRKMPQEAIVILIVGFCAGGLAHLLALLAKQSSDWGGFGELAGTSVYSAVLGPFLSLPLDWLMRIKRKRSTPVRQFGRRKK
jgi:rod shape-determining protein MreD